MITLNRPKILNKGGEKKMRIMTLSGLGLLLMAGIGFALPQPVSQSGNWNANATITNTVTIQGNVGLNAGSNNIGDVDVLTMPAVNATITNTITETNSNAIKTSLDTLDNAISGNEMQVDVLTLPSLPAGENHVGTVAIRGTIPVTQGLKTPFSSYEVNTSLAASGNDADLGTTTLSVASRLTSVRITADGSVRGILYIGSTAKGELATSPSHRSDTISFGDYGLAITSGQAVYVSVTNEDSTNAQRVTATLVGYNE
ncbi:MAG: hypothetical protein ACOYWZ_08745 [Bacillota bacterium]